MNPVRFTFSDDKKVQRVLSAKFGEGWEASLPVLDMVRGLDWFRGGGGVLCDLVSCDCHVTALCPGV